MLGFLSFVTVDGFFLNTVTLLKWEYVSDHQINMASFN